MSEFVVKASSGEGFEVPPAGNQAAALVAVIDLGTHHGEYQGAPTKNRKVYFAWELTNRQKKGGGNFTIARDYNYAFGKNSNLRKLVESWLGVTFANDEPYNLFKLLGRPCLLNLKHKESAAGNTYAVIGGVAPPLEGLTINPPKCEPVGWLMSEGDPIPSQEWLPYLYGEPLQEVIKRSDEWKAKYGQSADAPADDDNEAPF